MENIESIVAFLSSPLFAYLVQGFLIYLAFLWLALVVWVARDIVNRSNNILLQVLCILINLLFPVFGLILYLILRPQRTLLERYYDEMEHEFFLEFQEESEKKAPSGTDKKESKSVKKSKKNKKPKKSSEK